MISLTWSQVIAVAKLKLAPGDQTQTHKTIALHKSTANDDVLKAWMITLARLIRLLLSADWTTTELNSQITNAKTGTKTGPWISSRPRNAQCSFVWEIIPTKPKYQIVLRIVNAFSSCDFAASHNSTCWRLYTKLVISFMFAMLKESKNKSKDAGKILADRGTKTTLRLTIPGPHSVVCKGFNTFAICFTIS